MLEKNNMHGALTLQLRDQDGKIVREQRCSNRIVTSGRELVAQLFAGKAKSGDTLPAAITHIAVGTGNTEPADGDLILVAERSPRKPISKIDYSEITDSGVKRVRVRLTTIFGLNDVNGNDPLQEAGIFNAETGGDLYNRVVFEPVTKTDSFKLTLLWDIVF